MFVVAAATLAQLADLVEFLGDVGLEEAEFGFVTSEELGWGGVCIGHGFVLILVVAVFLLYYSSGSLYRETQSKEGWEYVSAQRGRFRMSYGILVEPE